MDAHERRAEQRRLESEYKPEKDIVVKGLRDDLYNVKVLVEKYGPTRPRSIAITHIEEAILWLEAEDRLDDPLFARKPWKREGA